MRDLNTLEKQLVEVQEELHELYMKYEKGRRTNPRLRIYIAKINDLLKRERNLYVNINQEKQRRD